MPSKLRRLMRYYLWLPKTLHMRKQHGCCRDGKQTHHRARMWSEELYEYLVNKVEKLEKSGSMSEQSFHNER